MSDRRERIPIRPGDYLRYPDRATARWHRVVRVSRRKDGTRFITIRRSKLWRAFGLLTMQRIEWAHIRAIGYGLKRAQAPSAPALQKVEPVRPWSPPPETEPRP